MALKEPASMDECVYFTNRNLGEKGKIRAWVYRQNCPKCNKALMGKPRDKGKIKIRATEYVCPNCKYTAQKEEYEDTLTFESKYVCPHCEFTGEVQIPFKRKKVKVFDEETQKQVTAESVRFQCSKCGKSIDVTKKMK
ncbi:hypothetical protein HYU23_00385 [Candidatus Woesearchaeota archaeon]|nr:hypothetical protein [Candidatus Woesearchaeota archaeon]